MALIEAFLPEYDHEMEYTREFLHRIPNELLDWQPHPKSMRVNRLAGHLAEIPKWVVALLAENSFDVLHATEWSTKPFTVTSQHELLETFNRNVSDARATLLTTDDVHLLRPWSLLRGGQTLYTKPRYGILRNTILNHVVHHRAQLGVYFRLNDIPVPAVYGPTADEQPRTASF